MKKFSEYLAEAKSKTNNDSVKKPDGSFRVGKKNWPGLKAAVETKDAAKIISKLKELIPKVKDEIFTGVIQNREASDIDGKASYHNPDGRNNEEQVIIVFNNKKKTKVYLKA